MFLVEWTKSIRNSTDATEIFILSNSTLSIPQPSVVPTIHEGPLQHENISSKDVPVQKTTVTGIITSLIYWRGNVLYYT